MMQATLNCYYSEEKAKLKYADFLQNFQPIVEYQEKKEPKQVSPRKARKPECAKPPTVTEDG